MTISAIRTPMSTPLLFVFVPGRLGGGVGAPTVIAMGALRTWSRPSKPTNVAV
jgi:hypothetical protein